MNSRTRERRSSLGRPSSTSKPSTTRPLLRATDFRLFVSVTRSSTFPLSTSWSWRRALRRFAIPLNLSPLSSLGSGSRRTAPLTISGAHRRHIHHYQPLLGHDPIGGILRGARAREWLLWIAVSILIGSVSSASALWPALVLSDPDGNPNLGRAPCTASASWPPSTTRKGTSLRTTGTAESPFFLSWILAEDLTWLGGKLNLLARRTELSGRSQKTGADES
jgi:hypothetical protein